MKKLMRDFRSTLSICSSNPLKTESGQSVVEFALMLPIFLLLVFGIIEFGILFNMKLSVTNCAREGARYAALHSEESSLESTIESRVRRLAVFGDIDVAVSFSNPSNHKSGDVTVTVTAQANALTPVGDLLFSNGRLILTGTVIMKVE
ncbi:MAG: TadE/TadG family type IV pilus assembly protein [Oscillospiraceae bacterium]|nr:TadE/TadG family type IV pilus assembly protein [Oscillospiraceae bacterium]